jgi:outer membrane protein
MTIRLFIAAICIAGATTLSAAELKVATINMEKVFHDFHKTKAADNKLKEQREVYKNYAVNLGKEIQEGRKKLQTLIEDAQNIVLSDEIRKQKAQEANDLRRSLMDKSRELESYQKDRMAKLQEEYQKERDVIVGEIQEVIKSIAGQKSVDFVLDLSGRTTNQMSAVVFAKPGFEITDEVIGKLNEGQPAAE